MENQIDDILNILMENINNTTNNNINNTRNNVNNVNNVNNNRNTSNTTPFRFVNRQLDAITNLITLYSHNQIEYQRNIQSMLALLQLNHQSFRSQINQTNLNNTTRTTNNNTRSANTRREYVWRSPHTNTQPTNTQPTNNIWNGVRNTGQTNADWTNLFNTYLNNIEENERRLTNTEINNSLRIFTFSTEIANTLTDARCPISLDPFVDGDMLAEIRGCHHVFRRDNLMRWLTRSNGCPICRYNMLTQTPVQPPAPAPTPAPAVNVPNVPTDTSYTDANNIPLDTYFNNDINTVDISNNVDVSANGYVYSFTTSLPTNINNVDMSNDIYNFYNQALNNLNVPPINTDVSDNDIPDIPDNISVD